MKKNYSVVLCIGTPRVSGDSLGPKVGEKLIKKYNTPAYVYGTERHPVTGINYEQYLEHLKIFHPNSNIIAVDACLGKKDDVGTVKYSLHGLCAGTALKKELGTVGNIGFLGIVGAIDADNFAVLSRVPESVVERLSDEIASKIDRICQSILFKI